MKVLVDICHGAAESNDVSGRSLDWHRAVWRIF